MVTTEGPPALPKATTPPAPAEGPLYGAPRGSQVRVLAIRGGWGARRNLNQIGVHVGDQLQVIRKAPLGGPILVKSHGAEVAIGRRLAEKVIVERVG